jgi:hypothetical protein
MLYRRRSDRLYLVLSKSDRLLGISNSGIEIGVSPYKPEHKKYRKEVQGRGAVDGDLYIMKDGIVNVPYARILIRRRTQPSKKDKK